MRLDEIRQNRILLAFQYARIDGDREDIVARGTHQVAVMQRRPSGLVAASIPEELTRALREFDRAAPA